MKITILVLFLAASQLFGRTPQWFSGSVVLSNRVVLVGEVSMEPLHHTLLFRDGGDEVQVFPAHRIEAFYFYDHDADVNRKFVSRSRTAGGWKRFEFFEMVLHGEPGVVRQQRLSRHHIHDDGVDFIYYVSFKEDLTSLKKFRSRIYPHLVRSAGDALIDFVKENKLDPIRPANAIEILEYFNRNFSAKEIMVRN